MPAPSKISARQDLQMVKLHEAGVATRVIEQILGFDHTTISRRLKRLTPRKTTEIYRELKADVLAEKQRHLLMMAQRAEPREQDQIARAFKVYNESERLERNQSTANLGVQHGISAELADLVSSITGSTPRQGIEQIKKVSDI